MVLINNENEKSRFIESERKRLSDHLNTEGDKRDAAIFTISAGAVVLSVPQAVEFAKIGHLFYFEFLVGSWVILVFAIISTIVSYYLSEKGALECNHKLDHYEKNINEYDSNNRYYQLGIITNYISGASLIIGIILLLIFTFKTISDIQRSSLTTKATQIIYDIKK